MDQPILVFAVSLAGALGPMVLFTGIVWWMDRYEREPVRLVALLFIYGAIPGTALTLIAHLTLTWVAARSIPSSFHELVSIVALAPLLEELAKALPLFFIWKLRDFNNPTDGIVYGSAIGFGFSMTENLFYFLDSYYGSGVGRWVWTMVIRTLFTGTLHAFSTGIVGYMIGRAKFHHVRPVKAFGTGLGVALLAHVVWNLVILQAEVLNLPHYFYTLLACFPLLIVILLVLMQVSLWDESMIIREELAEEVAKGVISLREFRTIPYYHRRNRSGWIDPAIKREYLRIATTLAFKKRERRYRSEHEQAEATREISDLRKALQGLKKGISPII